MTWPATPELVAVAWLKGVTGIDSTDVGDTLPEDNSTWAACGYTQMVAITGGIPGMYVQQRVTTVQVDFWAVNPNDALVPWGKARNLGELVIASTYTQGQSGARDVSANMPSGFFGAYVQSAYPLSELRRVPNDPSSYARYTLDLALVWVGLPT